MNKFKILSITISIFIIIGTLIYNYGKSEEQKEYLKMFNQKEKYENINNPYYIDSKINDGIYFENTSIDFLRNKSYYYNAQKDFDLGNYEEALILLNKITMTGFNSLKYVLEGDIYYYMNDKVNSKKSYNNALRFTNKDNLYLKESIFSKLQMASK